MTILPRQPRYSPATEARALRWLVNRLPRAKGTTRPGEEPVIDRIYYFRSFQGTDPDGDNITPAGASPNQRALYEAIRTR